MTGTPIVDSWANGPAIDWPASARQMEEVAHELADALQAVVLTIRGGEDEALRILKTAMPDEQATFLKNLEISLVKWKAMQP